MFIRECKVRSNNQIKSSEKKAFLKEVLKQYPSVQEDQLKSIINVKESEINLSKVETHDGTHLVVYLIDKIPYFFKIEKTTAFIPSVYFLWRFPNILPKFYTHKPVFSKLLNGADLMLPGVITPASVDLYTFKHIQKDQLCALCLSDNDSPIAIGRAQMSGEDMYMSGMRGKCLSILNIHRDNLWAMGDKSIEIPNIPILMQSSFNVKDSYQENFPTLGSTEEKVTTAELKKEANNVAESDDTVVSLKTLDINEKTVEVKDVALEVADEDVQDLEPEIDHEKILLESFQCAIRFKKNEFKLPVIVSTFMKVMQSCCPPGIPFDLKKTRFKKISTFLKEMESMHKCIKLKDQKGVLSITSFVCDNPLFTYYKRPDWMKDAVTGEAIKELKPEDLKFVFEIFEVYKIDGNSESLFWPKYKKNDVVTAAEVRHFVTNYIKENNLQVKDEPKCFVPNEKLTKAFLKKAAAEEKMTFETLWTTVFQKLTPMHQIKRVFKDKKLENNDGILLRKGKYQPVEFKLENRGGNKKVTSIYNLATFEMDFLQLQQKLRKDIGCSVSLVEQENPSPGASMYQTKEHIVQVQGNQITSIADLLKSEFGIQHKHMKGLELGIKKT